MYGGLGVVGFVDTGNVFARTDDIDLGEFRTAVGFGLRYKSPIGPIRVDLGFKVHRQTIAGRREDLTAIQSASDRRSDHEIADADCRFQIGFRLGRRLSRWVVRIGLRLACLALRRARGRRARGRVIDRVLAVVGNQMITLTDVTAARDLGLVPAPAAGDPIRASCRG